MSIANKLSIKINKYRHFIHPTHLKFRSHNILSFYLYNFFNLFVQKLTVYASTKKFFFRTENYGDVVEVEVDSYLCKILNSATRHDRQLLRYGRLNYDVMMCM